MIATTTLIRIYFLYTRVDINDFSQSLAVMNSKAMAFLSLITANLEYDYNLQC